MKRANLFAIAATDLERAKLAIESTLRVQLSAHESEYHGGEYYRGECAGVSLVLQENFVEDDGEPTEAEFPLAKLLLYVDGLDRDVENVGSTLLPSGCVKELLRSNAY